MHFDQANKCVDKELSEFRNYLDLETVQMIIPRNHHIVFFRFSKDSQKGGERNGGHELWGFKRLWLRTCHDQPTIHGKNRKPVHCTSSSNEIVLGRYLKTALNQTKHSWKAGLVCPKRNREDPWRSHAQSEEYCHFLLLHYQR